MKHLVLIFFAIVCVAFAGCIVIPNRHALTLVHLCFAGGAIVLAMLLAIPADAKAALCTLTNCVQTVRGSLPGS